MPHDTRTVLEDVRQAAERIVRFTGKRSLEDYKRDELLRSGVERQFEIIGEALGRLRRLDDDAFESISYAPRIIAFRNVLAHGYDVVEDETVWDIVVTYLPELLGDVQRLLAADA